jgi:hypothetical protein
MPTGGNMNIKTLLMLVAILNVGALYSSDMLLARGGERGGAEFRGGDEFRGHDEFRGEEHEHQGARDAAALGAAHRSGEEEGSEAAEGYYAPPPEYYPCGFQEQNQQNPNQPSQ